MSLKGQCLVLLDRPLKALLPRRIFDFHSDSLLQNTCCFAVLWLPAHANLHATAGHMCNIFGRFAANHMQI